MAGNCWLYKRSHCQCALIVCPQSRMAASFLAFNFFWHVFHSFNTNVKWFIGSKRSILLGKVVVDWIPHRKYPFMVGLWKRLENKQFNKYFINLGADYLTDWLEL